MVTGITDENGWQEIHQVTHRHTQCSADDELGSVLILCACFGVQACRYGNVQHLEHLLFYGADMSSQNASGNTALHLCALYNQVTLGRRRHVTDARVQVCGSDVGSGSAGQLRPGSAVQRSQQGHQELQQPDGLSGKNIKLHKNTHLYHFYR